MKLEGLRILVTGASGFIGSHLAERLADANQLVLVDDFSVGPRRNLAALEDHARCTIAPADVADRERMQSLCEGVDVVFHLACSCLRTSLGSPFASHDVNAGGSLALALAAQQAGVARFVYVSSSEVYGSARQVPMTEDHPLAPTTVYGASKLAGELYTQAVGRTHGLPVSVVRPFNTYGPREPAEGARAELIPRFLLRLEAGEPPIIFGDGSQTRDFTFVRDTVTGLVAAAECDALVGDVVNIAFGHEVSVRRIAEALGELTGRPELAPVREAARPGDVLRHYADTSKARRLLGFEAATDLATGLAETLTWFRDQGPRPSAAASGSRNW